MAARPYLHLCPSACTDYQLASHCSNNHTRAAEYFNELHARHTKSVYLYALKMAGRDAAEDLTQTTFTSAWVSLQAGSHVEYPQAWLKRICHNASLDYLRKSKVTSEIYEDITDVSDPIAERQEWAGVVMELQRLPDNQRRALVHRELEGRSYEETAAIMNCTPTQVRGLLHRARTTMRTSLGAIIAPFPFIKSFAELFTTAGSSVAASSSSAITVKLSVTAAVAVSSIGGVAVEHKKADSKKPSQTVSQTVPTTKKRVIKEKTVVASVREKSSPQKVVVPPAKVSAKQVKIKSAPSPEKSPPIVLAATEPQTIPVAENPTETAPTQSGKLTVQEEQAVAPTQTRQSEPAPTQTRQSEPAAAHGTEDRPKSPARAKNHRLKRWQHHQRRLNSRVTQPMPSAP